jgi:hypothetical protein
MRARSVDARAIDIRTRALSINAVMCKCARRTNDAVSARRRDRGRSCGRRGLPGQDRMPRWPQRRPAPARAPGRPAPPCRRFLRRGRSVSRIVAPCRRRDPDRSGPSPPPSVGASRSIGRRHQGRAGSCPRRPHVGPLWSMSAASAFLGGPSPGRAWDRVQRWDRPTGDSDPIVISIQPEDIGAHDADERSRRREVRAVAASAVTVVVADHVFQAWTAADDRSWDRSCRLLLLLHHPPRCHRPARSAVAQWEGSGPARPVSRYLIAQIGWISFHPWSES